ncbi:transcriptional antiterminator [Pokkaliibacter plantistimulans]|uniref:Transcriptional antiterminator n=1 Tax=Pokkaliibacter plantistimulans TaxID=1635171 RepID=A0ABX5LXW3_9GAMM|nr:Rho-binding antiterminator [Pokkaliibacter plantistimulans]PXF31037.1 transcriptional antiterminator [Pokkaliibacter plantistimulans]
MSDSSAHYQPISCDLHDYLEIACMRGYVLLVELTDGSRFEAKAITTLVNADKEEFLRLRGATGDQDIRLDRLAAITPQAANAGFGRVRLAGSVCQF